MRAEEALCVANYYTKQTVIGMGAIKGSPCIIKSITKSGPVNTVVFEWTDLNDVKHESTMLVNDGTDGAPGTDGNPGADGFSPTIVVKESSSDKYILTITDKNGSYDTPNLKGSGGGGASAMSDLTDVQLTSLANGDALIYDSVSSTWKNVALADVATSGAASDVSYDNTTSQLVATTAQGAIDEVVAALDDKQDELTAGDGINIDAQNEISVQKRLIVTDTMPTASADYVGEGKQRLYVGTTGTYTKGTIYECQADPEDPTAYLWVAISTAEVDLTHYKKIFEGTTAQWNALNLSQKLEYDLCAITDDGETGDIATVVESGNGNPVTSGATYTYGEGIKADITTAIEALDVTDTAVAGSYVTAVSETDGVISVTREAADAAPTASSNKMVKSGGVYSADKDIYKYIGEVGAKNFAICDLNRIKSGTTGATWNGNVATINGGTVTINENGSAIINGTFSATSEVFYYKRSATGDEIYRLPDGDYILSGGDASVGVTSFCTRNSGYYEYAKSLATSVPFTVLSTDGNSGLAIAIAAGTYDNVIVYPMIRLASDIDDTYQPYAKTNKQLTDDSAVKTQISNPNLLDNPWFTVNQRGQSTYSSVNYTYTTDRWLGSDGFDLYVNSDGVSVSVANKSLFQRIDSSLYSQLVGRTVTLSAMKADGSIVNVTGIVKSTGNSFKNESDSDVGLYLTKDNIASFVQILLKNTTVKLRAVKLEIGTVSTLAMDTVPNYQQELAKCQRYYVRYTANRNATGLCVGAFAASKFYGDMYLPCPMRDVPSVNSSGTRLYLHKNGAIITDFTIAMQSVCGNIAKLMITPTDTTGISSADLADFQMTISGDYFELSADI